MSKLLNSGQMINLGFKDLSHNPIGRASTEDLIKYNLEDFYMVMRDCDKDGSIINIRSAVNSLTRVINFMDIRIKKKHCE